MAVQTTRIERRQESIGTDATAAENRAGTYLKQFFDAIFEAGYQATYTRDPAADRVSGFVTLTGTATGFLKAVPDPPPSETSPPASPTTESASGTSPAPTSATSPSSPSAVSASISTPAPPTPEQAKQSIDPNGELKRISTDLIFPMVTEVTLEINQIPNYIIKFNQLFQFYTEQLLLQTKQIKNYNLFSEIPALSSFLTKLQIGITKTDKIKPFVFDSVFEKQNPEAVGIEKTVNINDYNFITLKILTSSVSQQDLPQTPANSPDVSEDPAAMTAAAITGTPVTYEKRKFQDGSERDVLVYSKIDFIYLRDGNLPESTNTAPIAALQPTSVAKSVQGKELISSIPIETSLYGISPTTLALFFNMKRIIDEQINPGVPAALYLCQGKQTALAKLQSNGVKIGGIPVGKLSSKVLAEDFINAYMMPARELESVPSKPASKVTCSTEDKVNFIRATRTVSLYNFGKPPGTFEIKKPPQNTPEYEQYEKYIEAKKLIAEISKKCPDLTGKEINFEGIKNLKEIGQIFEKFINKYNISCLVDEALKCVMPQLSCEEILRDISMDNVEQRLNLAFPYAKKVTAAIIENIKKSAEDENKKREKNGEPPLDRAGQTQIILDGINAFIDIEFVCKIDIMQIGAALAAAWSALQNIDIQEFLMNLFDWQFDMMVDLDDAIIKTIIQTLLATIDQLINSLIGCNSFDSLIASIIGGQDADVSSGLYGDLANLFSGDSDFSNTSQLFQNSLNNFLTQSSDEFSKIIKYKTTAYNPVFNTTLSSYGTVGYDTLQPSIAADTTTQADLFGGLITTKARATNPPGPNSWEQSSLTVGVDVEVLGQTENQKSFLREIGKFQGTLNKDTVNISRISDDSIVNLVTVNRRELASSGSFDIFDPNTYSEAVSASVSEAGQNITDALNIYATASGDRQGTPVTITSTTAEQSLTAGNDSQTIQFAIPKRDIFTQYGLNNKNRVIFDALIEYNKRDSTATIAVTQDNLSEQLKKYIKTCFCLLSPSETIDLVTGVPSQEVLLTIAEISKIKFPVIHMILQFPETHGLLFSTFGKMTNMDSIAPRLQILGSSPKLQATYVDPNVCLPFNSVSDFKKQLARGVLPEDLADKLIDDLVEEDRKNYNKLADTLAGVTRPASLLSDPKSLSANRTFDGKPIEEVDNAISRALGNIFSDIKNTFNKELQMLPEALSVTVEEPKEVYKFVYKAAKPIQGFNTPSGTHKSLNFEFKQIQDSFFQTREDGTREKIPGSPEPQGDSENPYYTIKSSNKKTGEFFKKIFENTKVKKIDPAPETNPAEQTSTSTNPLQIGSSLLNQDQNNISNLASLINSNKSTDLDIEIIGFLTDSNTDESILQKFRKPTEIPQTSNMQDSMRDYRQIYSQDAGGSSPPKWRFRYTETNTGDYNFTLKTAGKVATSRKPDLVYASNFKTSGSIERTEGIRKEISELFGTPLANYGRREVFNRIIKNNIKNTAPVNPFLETAGILEHDMSYIYDTISFAGFSSLVSKYLSTDLLKTTKTSQFEEEQKTIILNLINFTPEPTKFQIENGIDNHLLQLSKISERVKEEFNNSIPQDMKSLDSTINTRYTSNKPGDLSEKIMTGLAEVFIRTSVLDSVFKGLFVFDVHRYSLTQFDLLELIYLFFENRVKADIKNSGIQSHLEQEIEKIFELYKKQQPPIIPSDDSGNNKLSSLIRYYLNDCLKILAKLLGKCDTPRQATANKTGKSYNITATGIVDTLRRAANTDPVQTNRRKEFIDTIPRTNVYSNFYKYKTEKIQINLQPTSEETTARIGSGEVLAEYEITAATPDPVYTSDPWNWMQSDYAKNTLFKQNKIPGFILEQFVELEFQDENWYLQYKNISNTILSKDQQIIKEYFPSLKKGEGKMVMSLLNFNDLRRNFALFMNFRAGEYGKSYRSSFYIYNPEKPQYSILKSPPKYGIRLSLLKTHENTTLDKVKVAENYGYIDRYYYNFDLYQSFSYLGDSTGKKIAENKNLKQGPIQPYSINPVILNAVSMTDEQMSRYANDGGFFGTTGLADYTDRGGIIAESYKTSEGEQLDFSKGQIPTGLFFKLNNAAVSKFKSLNPGAEILTPLENAITVVPILNKYVEMPEQMYNFVVSEITQDDLTSAYEDFEQNQFEKLKKQIEDDPITDLLVNYCLIDKSLNTFALLNSIIGSANENLMRLFEQTKEVIVDNYELNLNSGNFKGNPNRVSRAERGPSIADMMKAAVSIPIGTLKGLSTTIDPNLFLADKIVGLAKTGLIVPKYKVVKAGEKYKIKGTNEMVEIETEGVAIKAFFDHIDGEFVVLDQPGVDETPLTDFTPVALVETVGNKTRIKRPPDFRTKPENKYIIKQGPGFFGVPMIREGNDYMSANGLTPEDEEDLNPLDMGLSAPIFPGEPVNIPYSVASLALAPFPIFGPASLTTYNIAYPFGPLFLGLEPLIYQNPGLVAGIPKQRNSIQDTANNFDSCELDKKSTLKTPPDVEIGLLTNLALDTASSTIFSIIDGLTPLQRQQIKLGTPTTLGVASSKDSLAISTRTDIVKQIKNVILSSINNFNSNPIAIRNLKKLITPSELDFTAFSSDLFKMLEGETPQTVKNGSNITMPAKQLDNIPPIGSYGAISNFSSSNLLSNIRQITSKMLVIK